MMNRLLLVLSLSVLLVVLVHGRADEGWSSRDYDDYYSDRSNNIRGGRRSYSSRGRRGGRGGGGYGYGHGGGPGWAYGGGWSAGLGPWGGYGGFGLGPAAFYGGFPGLGLGYGLELSSGLDTGLEFGASAMASQHLNPLYFGMMGGYPGGLGYGGGLGFGFGDSSLGGFHGLGFGGWPWPGAVGHGGWGGWGGGGGEFGRYGDRRSQGRGYGGEHDYQPRSDRDHAYSPHETNRESQESVGSGSDFHSSDGSSYNERSDSGHPGPQGQDYDSGSDGDSNAGSGAQSDQHGAYTGRDEEERAQRGAGGHARRLGGEAASLGVDPDED